MAASRGWVVGAGLPDEARAGRAILKDFCDGKLLSYEWPPGHIGGAHALIQPPPPQARVASMLCAEIL